MMVTRRSFLAAIGGSAALGAHAPMKWGWPSKLLGAVGSSVPFEEPKILRSANGTLHVELVAAPRAVRFGAGTRWAYTYGGTSPGPTLRVRPGDVLSITLENRLGQPTNLHTHGLHVSPSGSADNIFVSIPDGARRTYTYEIPASHRSGTFWYHPHRHELVAPQLFGGLAGVIVVEDAIDSLPELAAASERVFVLSDPVIGSSSHVLEVPMRQRMFGREGDVVLVNGVQSPTIAATAGTLEHWRVVNASPSRYYRLTLERHGLTVVGTDGGRLPSPVEVPELLLAPGERTELLVAPSAAGSYRLRSLPYDRGTLGMMGAGGASAASSTRTLVTLQVAGDAPAAAMPATVASADALGLAAPTRRREVVFAMGMGGGGMGGMGGGGNGRMEGSFTIDGKTFDPKRTDITTGLGRIEEWTLSNASTMDHPFHLHVWPFQVVARSDGEPVLPGWKDTVNLPAGTTVTVHIPFTRIGGRTVYHCHILDHEDLGMMGVIRVH
jgi:FtsP/CotA-like multicopper oxidase with cupredoxin domain